MWQWRLVDEAEPWYEGNKTSYAAHESWFSRCRGRIKMWDENGETMGAVRIESDGTLHFTTDPAHRAVAPQMVTEALNAAYRHSGRLKAVVDKEDVWRTAVLKAAGFQEFPATALIYKVGR